MLHVAEESTFIKGITGRVFMNMTSKLFNNLANGAPKISPNNEKKFTEDLKANPVEAYTSVWEIGLSVGMLTLGSRV